MLVKICGLTTVEEAGYLNEYKADLAGFVLFFPKSKRNLTIEQARPIMQALDPAIKKVAVVVKPSPEQAKAICQAGFDYIQIHGPLDPAVLDIVSIPILKAFNVNDLDEFSNYQKIDKIAGYVFDATEPGSGKTFDWTMLKQLPIEDKLCIIAGGLHVGNVSKVAKMLQPDGVDVSSGVENDNGIGKNPYKIKQFIAYCR